MTAMAGAAKAGKEPNPDSRTPRLFERVARSRFAVPAMGLLSLLDACVSPILPEVILVPLILARPARRHFYALVCAATSVIGAVVGYYIGYGLWESGLREFAYDYVPGFSPEAFETTSNRFGSHAFLWIVLAAFTPLPFKVFTVAAGVCHGQVSLETLVLGSIVGRLPRFLIETELIHRFGPGFIAVLRRPKWRIALLIACGAFIIFAML